MVWNWANFLGLTIVFHGQIIALRNINIINEPGATRLSMSLIHQKSPHLDDFLVDMRGQQMKEEMKHIAGCYMSDPCFKKPREPTTMHVSQDPVGVLNKPGSKLHYFSYGEWWDGVKKAWQDMRRYSPGMQGETPKRQTILIVPFFGGAAAGTAGESDDYFDQQLAAYPKMFYKSELWMQMHLLYHFVDDICGIAFVGRDSNKRRLNPHQGYELERVCNQGANGEELKRNKRCNFALAFDVTYSGIQLKGDAIDMFGRGGKKLLGQHIPGTVVHDAEPHRRLVLLGVTHNAWNRQYVQEEQTLDYRVILGHNEKTGYSERVPDFDKIPGGRRPLLIPQFKIPDGASLDENVAGHVEWLLCSCGYDTRRPPYKVYIKQFRQLQKDGSCKPSRMAPGWRSSDIIPYCHKLFDSYGQAPGSSGPSGGSGGGKSHSTAKTGTGILRTIQDQWRRNVVNSRCKELFDWNRDWKSDKDPTGMDANDSGKLSMKEWMDKRFGIQKFLKLKEWSVKKDNWNEKWDETKKKETLVQNFEYLCEQAPSCDPNDENNKGVPCEEFKYVLDRQ